MSALWGEMKVTACTPHAGKQSINSAISQDIKRCRLRYCRQLMSAVCLDHFDSLHQYTTHACQGRSARRGVIERRGGMQGGEGRGKQTRGGRRAA